MLKMKIMSKIFIQNLNHGTKKIGIAHVDSFHFYKMCKTRENFNFRKNGKIVISVKIRKFSRSRMTKRISPLESSREI